MNKTLTINLGGRVFHADEDAYKLLYDYLYNLRHAFARQEGCDEIVDDLENRLSELLNETLDTRQEVITVAAVEATIARLGKPEEIADNGNYAPAHEASTDTAQAQGTTADEAPRPGPAQTGTSTDGNTSTPPPFEVRKRLFRDPDNRMLGGVLGGLANYLGWDPTLLRLVLVLLMFCYGIVIPIYLVSWMVIPLAVTAADKLSMHGRQITIENIGKVVTDSFDTAGKKMDNALHNAAAYMQSDKPRTAWQRFADWLASVIGTLLTVMLAILAILLSPALLLCVFLIGVFLFACIAVCTGSIIPLYETFPFLEDLSMSSPVLTFIGYSCLFIGLTLVLFCGISGIFRLAFKWKKPSSRSLKILLVTGLISLIVAALFGAMADNGPTGLPMVMLEQTQPL